MSTHVYPGYFQSYLATVGAYFGDVDGDFGPSSAGTAALACFLQKWQEDRYGRLTCFGFTTGILFYFFSATGLRRGRRLPRVRGRRRRRSRGRLRRTRWPRSTTACLHSVCRRWVCVCVHGVDDSLYTRPSLHPYQEALKQVSGMMSRWAKHHRVARVFVK